MKSAIGIALSVSKRPVPRDPSSSDTRAIVVSSGASTIETKSKRPRTDHWALTVAPSCSTSVLTSRMRCGLFLTVWTPSGVSVESMMNVGIALLLPDPRVRRGTTPNLLGPLLMRRTVVVLPLALLLAPAAAHGAQVQTDRTCYLQTAKT